MYLPKTLEKRQNITNLNYKISDKTRVFFTLYF